jgi:hypothetical protein
MVLRLGRLRGAHVDDDAARPQRLGDAPPEQHLLDDPAVLQHQHDELGLPDGVGGLAFDARAQGGQGVGLLPRAVPCREGPAGLEEAPRLPRPHQAGPEERNRPGMKCHVRSPDADGRRVKR